MTEKKQRPVNTMATSARPRIRRNWPSITGTDLQRASRGLTRLEDITRLISEWVWEVDTTGRFTFVSDRVHEQLGLIPVQIVTKTFSELGSFINDDGKNTEPDWNYPFRDALYKTQDTSGAEKLFLISGIPYYDPDTFTFEGVSGTAHDITDLKHNEEALRQYSDELEARVIERTAELQASESRLEATLALAPAAVISVNSELNITMFNHGAEQIFGFNAAEIIGQPIERLLPERFQHLSEECFKDHNLLVNGSDNKDATKEIFGLCKDRTTFLASTSVSKIIQAGKTTYIIVLQDITDRRKKEKHLIKLMRDTKNATQAKSIFLANMSHELRTPLNAIIGFAEMISNQYLGPVGTDQYLNYANDIRNSGKHLLSMVNDILDIERIEAGKYELHYELLDVPELIDECHKLLEQRAETGDISIETVFDSNLPALYADRRAILQVLINLVTNALKFTPKGGTVRIKAQTFDNLYKIQVQDTGIGIPADKMPTLIEPFSRHISDPHKFQEGVGLGLSISSSLIKLHKGELLLESEVGKGTTVTIALPRGEY